MHFTVLKGVEINKLCASRMRKKFCNKFMYKYIFLISTISVAMYIYAPLSRDGSLSYKKIRITLPKSEMGISSIMLQQQDRIKRLQNVCKNISDGRTNNILIYRAKRMSYCVVPKHGCTYWLRIMRFLNNDTGSRHVTSPFDLTREETHSMPYTQTLYQLHNKEQELAVFNTTRFMVSRNPYTKLLSGYIDKIYLPPYWSYQGIKIIRTVRRKPSTFSLNCGHDVTFQEFLEFLLTMQNSPPKIDGHFRPTQFYCSPCIFKPQLIVKQETFQQDSEFVLKQFDLQDLVKSYDHKSHVLDEIRSLTNDYYRWTYHDRVKRCLGSEKYIARIWKAFQINGYVRLESENVLRETSNLTRSKQTFQRLVLQNTHSEKARMQKQRHDMMANMYRSVSRETLEQIADMFHNDFELFDYEKYPKAIFS